MADAPNYQSPINVDKEGCDRISAVQWESSTRYYALGDERLDGTISTAADQVKNGNVEYKCIYVGTGFGHISGSSNEPGVGASWETYWEISYKHYTEDEDNYYYLDPLDPILVVRPDLANKKFRGYCWKICPFSTEWVTRSPDVFDGDGIYRTQIRQGLTVSYQFHRVPGSQQTDHPRTNGRMRFQMRGSVAGWVCDDLDCYHYTTLNSNRKFFLI